MMNNPPKSCDILVYSSAMLQPLRCTSHVYPLFVATMPSIRRNHSGGRRAANNFSIEKVPCTHVSPTKEARWCVMGNLTISHNFWTTKSYCAPSIWTCWSHNGESIIGNLCGENGFKGRKTRNVQKIGNLYVEIWYHKCINIRQQT